MMDDLVVLFGVATFCSAFAAGGVVVNRFEKKVGSLALIAAAISPWVAMLYFDSGADSEVAGWMVIFAPLFFYVIALVSFLIPPVNDRGRRALAMTSVGLVLSIAWVLSFLSVISLGHV